MCVACRLQLVALSLPLIVVACLSYVCNILCWHVWCYKLSWFCTWACWASCRKLYVPAAILYYILCLFPDIISIIVSTLLPLPTDVELPRNPEVLLSHVDRYYGREMLRFEVLSSDGGEYSFTYKV